MGKKLLVIALILIFLFDACKERLYRTGSVAMEKTLMRGETVPIFITDTFNRNDIVVFNIYFYDLLSPPDGITGTYKKHWERWLSRFVAGSGDTVLIKDGDLYVNNKLALLPEKAQMDYQITSDTPIDELLNDDQDFPGHGIHKEGNHFVYTSSLTKSEAYNYRHKPGVTEVKKLFTGDSDFSNTAKQFANSKWTVDNYGPLYIPSPGETITIDSANYQLYQHIPDVYKGRFTVKEKLYFVMGDNRHKANDSRYIGLISHSKMRGIVK